MKVRLKMPPSFAESLGMDEAGEIAIPDGVGKQDHSVRTALNLLGVTYSQFARFVFDTKTQELSSEVTVLLNGLILEPSSGLNTVLGDGDMLTIVPVIEGG